MGIVQQFAPVKVNLCLHVSGVRDDGLHDLASIALFPAIGDMIKIAPAERLSLEVTGAFAAELADLEAENNLVIRAARLLLQAAAQERGAAITLTKSVPPASGIGGGTSDAMTALALLRDFWALELGDEALYEISFQLGADGPVCLFPHLEKNQTAIMGGAGEQIAAGPEMGAFFVCLVNPLREVPTGQVFKIFDEHAPLPEALRLPSCDAQQNAEAVLEFFARTRNDLQAPAISVCPEIAMVLDFIEATKGCIAHRMSGSGATCFGLYENAADAQNAQERATERGWWAASGESHWRAGRKQS